MISACAAKNLSFPGKLQLLQLLLYSIQIYWVCLFVLPKKVTKAIVKKFSSFLWKGQENSVWVLKLLGIWFVCQRKKFGAEKAIGME